MFDVGACLAVSKNSGIYIYRVNENSMETSAYGLRNSKGLGF